MRPQLQPTSPAPRTSAAPLRRPPLPIKNWARGEEPEVADLLNDPVMRRLLAGDKIEPEALRSFVLDMRARLRRPSAAQHSRP